MTKQEILEARKRLHAGPITPGKRLEKTLRILKNTAEYTRITNGWISTARIHHYTNSMAVSSDITKLRAHGYKILCKRVGRIYYYRYEGKEK